MSGALKETACRNGRPKPDRDEIRRALDALCEPGDVLEFRGLGTDRKGTISGYYNDFDKAADDAVKISRMANGTYFTINQLSPDLLSRKANRFEEWVKTTTTDDPSQVIRRRYLFIDCDVQRPAGISATDDEKELALQKAREICRYLRECGWPDMVVGDSGNGVHLLPRIDLPNDQEAERLVKSCLEALDVKFSDEQVKVDTSVSNAARICKLPGTTVHKGDHTPDRPHRVSRLLHVPEQLEVVPRAKLEALAATVAEPEPTQANKDRQFTGEKLDVPRYLAEHGIGVQFDKPYKDGHKWVLAECALCHEKDNSAVVIQFGDGALSFRCQHNRCDGKGWHDFRDAVEPGWRDRRRAQQPRSRPEIIRPTGFPLTDAGNAQRLIARHGPELRFCHPWNQWFIWDGTRWKPDGNGEIMRRAKDTAREMLNEAASEPNDGARKALARHATSSESASRLEAMIRLAESEDGIAIDPEDMDSDPWALNVLNGTIDLRSGEMHPHRKSDLITKQAPVEYWEPSASECPLWESSLGRVLAGNDDLIQFIQRLLGYALTGVIRDQLLTIWYGTGLNGKSTILETFMALLGEDYSIKAAHDLLMAKKGAHPTERADLFGKRLAVCVESEDNRRLAESLVKELTGKDTIRARRMREDYWQFTPTHKLILATNHKPTVKGTDLGIWRRLCLVPFEVTIPADAVDEDLGEKLLTELPGILRWCVTGCLEWQRIGLNRPEIVKAATHDYRQGEDSFAGFLAECCVQDPQANTRARDLLTAYKEWSDDKRMSQRKFGQLLSDRGFDRFTSNGVWYSGIDLLTDVSQVS